MENKTDMKTKTTETRLTCRKHGSLRVYRVRLEMLNCYVHRCELCNIAAGRKAR